MTNLTTARHAALALLGVAASQETVPSFLTTLSKAKPFETWASSASEKRTDFLRKALRPPTVTGVDGSTLLLFAGVAGGGGAFFGPANEPNAEAIARNVEVVPAEASMASTSSSATSNESSSKESAEAGGCDFRRLCTASVSPIAVHQALHSDASVVEKWRTSSASPTLHVNAKARSDERSTRHTAGWRDNTRAVALLKDRANLPAPRSASTASLFRSNEPRLSGQAAKAARSSFSGERASAIVARSRVILWALLVSQSTTCVESTSVSGAPDNSSLSHFPAMTRPCWHRVDGVAMCTRRTV